MPFVYLPDNMFGLQKGGAESETRNIPPIDQGVTGPSGVQQDGGTFTVGEDGGTVTPGNISNYGGVNFVSPSFVDFSSLQFNPIDFRRNLNFAQGIGRQNRDTFFRNIDASRNNALNIVDTDILGINRGLDALLPRYRSEGNRDFETNISRAGRIDDFNLSRVGRFNEFNQQQTAASNEFNEAEFEESITSTGVDYRRRIDEVLGRLSEQAAGKLPEDVDAAISADLRNRGADLLTGSGISPLSSAGVRANDRLTVQERLARADAANLQIPGIAGQAQQLLQFTPERTPTTYATPTQVPFTPAQAAERIPITSGISAGQTQVSLGTQATNLETIPATQVLQSGLQTDQFNSSGQYNRDLAVLQGQQAQLTAADNALQGAINAQRADVIRQQAYEAYQEGFGFRQDADRAASFGDAAGFITGVTNALDMIPRGSAPQQQTTQPAQQGGTITQIPTTDGGSGPVYTGQGQSGPTTAPSTPPSVPQPVGGEIVSVGRLSIPQSDYDNAIKSSRAFYSGQDAYTGSGTPSQIDGVPVISTKKNQNGEPEYLLSDGSTRPVETPEVDSENSLLSGSFSDLIKPIGDVGRDAAAVLGMADIVQNWSTFSPSQQINLASQIATGVAENQGIITPNEGRGISQTMTALATLANPEASDIERATAIAQAGLAVGTTTFQGTINNPTSVNGVQVTGSQVNPQTGQTEFTLANDETISQNSLQMASDGVAALNAFSILSSNADTEDKLRALTSVGVSSAAAHEIIGQVAAGNVLAGLALFQTTTDWGQMNNLQRATSLLTTTNAVVQSAAAMSGAGAAEGIASGVLSYFGGQTAGTAAASSGAAAAGTGAAGGAAATSGTLSTIASVTGPLAIGAAIFGTSMALWETRSGKNPDQAGRDGWRQSLENMGIATLDPKTESHMVTLADGTQYDIGRDGNSKLPNSQTGERNTFDVDWNNQAAVNSIPEAHLFAIATGLDPTSAQSGNLFHRAVAQGLNAASSNANTVEGIRENFSAMMRDKVDPTNLLVNIERLRLGHKITDHEYEVYIDRTNKLFGTSFAPDTREKSKETMLKLIEEELPQMRRQQAANFRNFDSRGGGSLNRGPRKVPGYAQRNELFQILTDPKAEAKAQERLMTRVEKERRDNQPKKKKK